ncbi:MAG TPA: APC family permease [Chthoniobacterales bacterium]|nr:APC family permease [Chthoniobacterales bacterium]
MPAPHKKISLFSATALSATAMVGSGWLFSAQLNARLAGNYAFLSWFLAAVLVMAIGLCLSQVVAVYPVRGATTRSSALSHNPIFGMPFAFSNWFGLMVCVATEAQATTEYLSAYMKNNSLMDVMGLTFYGKSLALGILFLYLVINFYGIKLLSKVNNVVTVLKIFTPLFAIILFLITKFDKSNFQLATNSIYHASSTLTAIVGAGLIYSYNGFQLAAAFASEIKNPKRNVPLSIIISICLVMVVYMALQLSFMGAVPHAMLAGGWASLNLHSPLMNLALLLGLNFLALLLTADSVISPSGTGYAYLGASARMFYAMATEGQMPKWSIGKLNPIYNICRRSLLLNWILIALVLWNSQSWSTLMLVVTGYNLIGYMAAPISMGAIKPQTRIFGAIVFTTLGLIMTTIPKHDLFMMNLSLMVLMFIYGGIQLTKRLHWQTLLALIAPFMVYLWLIYFYQNLVYVGSVSLLFYLIITHTRYVLFCKAHKTESHFLEDDFGALEGN